MLLLLIYDYCAEPLERSENGASRAENDIDLAAPYSAEGIETLSAREPRMYNGESAAENSGECRNGLPCQRYLGDKNYRCSAVVDDVATERKHNACFAAPRNSVQKRRVGLAIQSQRIEQILCPRLLLREYRLAVRRGIEIFIWVSVIFAFFLAHEPFLTSAFTCAEV